MIYLFFKFAIETCALEICMTVSEQYSWSYFCPFWNECWMCMLRTATMIHHHHHCFSDFLWFLITYSNFNVNKFPLHALLTRCLSVKVSAVCGVGKIKERQACRVTHIHNQELQWAKQIRVRWARLCCFLSHHDGNVTLLYVLSPALLFFVLDHTWRNLFP